MGLFIAALMVIIVSVHATSHSQPKYKPNTPLGSVEYKNILEVKKTKNIVVSPTLGERFKSLKGADQDTINQFADQIAACLHDFFIHESYDPIKLPDLHAGFNYTLIINYIGELNLTQGWLHGLSTLHRSGNVTVTGTDILEILIPITYDALPFSYDYSAKIMGIGPRGVIPGKYDSLTIQLKFAFDTKKLVLSLEQFYITNLGFIIYPYFDGYPKNNWFDLLLPIIKVLLEETIPSRTEGVVISTVQDVVDQINDYLNGLTTVATYV